MGARLDFIVLGKGIVLRQKRVKGYKTDPQTMAQHEIMDEFTQTGFWSNPCRLVLLVVVGEAHNERVSKHQEKLHSSPQENFRVGRASRKCWHSTFTLARRGGL